MTPETALVLCRFVQDAALLLLWGGAAYLGWLVPQPLSVTLVRRLEGAATAATMLAVLAALAGLPIAAANLGAGWSDAAVPATLSAVLLQTDIGRAWMAQAGAGLLLVLAGFAPERRRARTVAVTAALGLAALTLTGHASMREGMAGLLHRGIDLLHLLAGGAWVGALPVLLIVLARLGTPEQAPEAAVALRRFSTAGHGAVALVIATGIGNVAMVLGRPPTDLGSLYQALLALKILIVCAMLALAVLNRYRLAPRLGADRGAMRALRRSTLAEIALGALVIALVAGFGTLEPV